METDIDEYTARRQADAEFAHEQLIREEAYAAGVAAERERCAKLIEPKNHPSDWTQYAEDCARLAQLIRSGLPYV